MRKYRVLLSTLTLSGKIALIWFAFRDRFRPIFPVIRSAFGLRKELREILRELRRINALIGR